MWIPLIFAVLFLAAAVSNSFGPERNLAEATAGYAIGVCLFATWGVMRGHAKYQADFLAWLVRNRDAIKVGTARFNEMSISERTEVTQYFLAASFLVISIKLPSRFYVVGEEESVLPRFAFTGLSLLLGWWGIPHGPIYTIGAVSSNLAGGKRRRVGDLLDELRGHERIVVNLTARAAENARRIIAERGFPAGTALQVEVTGKPGSLQYNVSYDDRPPDDGSVWKSEAGGVTVIVQKSDERRLAGLTVDFVGGEYTFQESAMTLGKGER